MICIDMLCLFLHGLGAVCCRLDVGLVPHQPPLSDEHLALLAHRLPELILERPAPGLLLRSRQALSPLTDAGQRGVDDLTRLRQCRLTLGPRSDVSYAICWEAYAVVSTGCRSLSPSPFFFAWVLPFFLP